MERVWGDVKAAWRSLARAPGFTTTVIATLALAIGLEAAVLAVVNAYLIRSLPYPAAERLYSVIYSRPGEVAPTGLAGLDWNATSDVIDHGISWDLDYFYLIGGEHPEGVPGAWVNPAFIRALGIRPVLGREFAPEEFNPGGPQVALISHQLWQSRFAGDPAILGRRFEAYVSDRPGDPDVFTIVGVLPAGFWHLNPYTEVLTPLRAPSYPYLVSLRAGVPTGLAEDRISALVGRRAEFQSVHARYSNSVKPMLLAIGTAVSLVLLIASANVAFLMLIRGLRRQKEVALRLALGAGTVRVARLLMTESLMLCAGAAAAGTALAVLILRLLAPVIQQQLGRPAPGGSAALSVDVAVLAAILVLMLVMALALPLVPLAATSRQTLFALMRHGRHTTAEGARGGPTRLSLIALEVAGSLTLVTGAGLMTRTVFRMLDVELGMQPAGIVGGALAIRERTYPDAGTRIGFYERLAAALAQAPGVSASAVSYPPPFNELDPRPIQADGADGLRDARAGVFTVSSDFFSALGIPVLEGRGFTAQDRAGAEPVVLVSETAARRLWPRGGAIGRGVRVATPGTLGGNDPVARTVVGVVGDARHSPTDDEVADVYVPWLQAPGRFAHLMVRGAGAPEYWQRELRRLLKGIDPEASLNNLRPLETTLSERLARPRFLAGLFAGVGLFATTLGLMGVYAVIAYASKQREHEIAVRIAVGADAAAIVRLLVRDGARVLLAGVVLGVIGAVGVGRVLEAQLFGVEAVDPATLAMAALGLAVASGAAIWSPARRASRTDPILALREE